MTECQADHEVATSARLLRRFFLSQYLVLGLSLACFAILALFAPGFATPNNLANILTSLMPLFLVAMGQTIVLITGGIDLSVTSIIALTSVVGALAMNSDHGWLAGSALATPVGTVLMLL